MSTTGIPKYAPLKQIPIVNRIWPSNRISKSPALVSVDLRDGNQALPNPMNPAQKLEYFNLLCRIGFKEIEVAFPSASQDDFDFTRSLIQENHIPADVWIMALTQCREHLINRTFEAFQGIRQGIIHAYIATSDLHIKHVFSLSRDETQKIAVSATKQIVERCNEMPDSDLRFEFSPEEFSDTVPEFGLAICTAVFEAWGKAAPDKPMILNLPMTVERRPPNEYADLIEWFCGNFKYRDAVKISLHCHNDQGMAAAAAELGLLAGADRVEGTLFGHGERTGNLDLITFASNIQSRGIDTGLDFTELPKIADTVERLTELRVHYRAPYAGDFAFTAFSGSHQDAIRKGLYSLEHAAEHFDVTWKVPYLHVDPADFGKRYENLIRINSQSGKGGAAWVLEHEFGIQIPKAMLPEIGVVIQKYAEERGRELSSAELREIFKSEFINPTGPYKLAAYLTNSLIENPSDVNGELLISVNGELKRFTACGNGPISAFEKCIKQLNLPEFTIEHYTEQAIGKGADATAVAFLPIKTHDKGVIWGVGMDSNIIQAAVHAIIAGLNRYMSKVV